MSNCNLLNVVMMCSAVFFAVISLLLLLKRTKQKKLLLNALKNNQASFDAQFENEEKQLKDALTEELSAQLTNSIAEIIAVEKDSYKKLCTLYIEYHPSAIELLPLTINKITSAYTDCIRQAIQLLKAQEVIEVAEEEIVETPISQHEALIEQLRSEKHFYSDRYTQAHQLFNMIFLKYKDKLEVGGDVINLDNMNINEIANAFNIEFEAQQEQ